MAATSVPAVFALGALALFFFVPGYFLVKALWPEKRWRAPHGGPMVALELVVGGFVASIALLVLVGFFLGNSGNFAAGPSDPTLEEILTVLSVLFLAAGWWRGAYRAEPPPPSTLVAPPLAGEEDVGPLFRRLEVLTQEEHRRAREVRRAERSGAPRVEVERLKSELEELRGQRRQVEQARQREIDG